MRYTLKIEKAPWLCTTSTFPMRAFFNGGSSTMRDHIITFWGQSLETFSWWGFFTNVDERQNKARDSS
jgi:hypothetical protein